ncbi:hypothetical protein MA16_Dca010077 [Dendrobium catenatum]|uniref:Uncharacterized protein n=1 Tax=Dendrobium catenatum TaxID=906689 RepID=A0A2I0X6Z4_9ASPA|nr:hypothetical protein MA16_Dca010077 [Dendrobium catenatum]
MGICTVESSTTCIGFGRFYVRKGEGDRVKFNYCRWFEVGCIDMVGGSDLELEFGKIGREEIEGEGVLRQKRIGGLGRLAKSDKVL